ncbi:hypothetical protein D3C86_1988100 [compost metagenome]
MPEVLGGGWVARLHGNLKNTIQNQCGSELARDSGLTVDENVDCQGLIASKLAPTGFCMVFNQA